MEHHPVVRARRIPGSKFLLIRNYVHVPFLSHQKFNYGDQRDFFRAVDMPLKFVSVVTTEWIVYRNLLQKREEMQISNCVSSCTGILITPYHVLTCAHGQHIHEIIDSTKKALKKRSK